MGVNVEKVGVRVSGNKSGSGNDIVRTRVEERSEGVTVKGKSGENSSGRESRRGNESESENERVRESVWYFEDTGG